MLFGNIWTIKLGILHYFLRTFVVLLPRALVTTSSPCARLSLVRFKNRAPKPSDAFRSVQNIFFSPAECSNINREPIVLIRYLATSVIGEAVEELYMKAVHKQFVICS